MLDSAHSKTLSSPSLHLLSGIRLTFWSLVLSKLFIGIAGGLVVFFSTQLYTDAPEAILFQKQLMHWLATIPTFALVLTVSGFRKISSSPLLIANDVVWLRRSLSVSFFLFFSFKCFQHFDKLVLRSNNPYLTWFLNKSLYYLWWSILLGGMVYLYKEFSSRQNSSGVFWCKNLLGFTALLLVYEHIYYYLYRWLVFHNRVYSFAYYAAIIQVLVSLLFALLWWRLFWLLVAEVKEFASYEQNALVDVFG